MRIHPLLFVPIFLAGCGGESLDEHPASPADVALTRPAPPTEPVSMRAWGSEGAATMQRTDPSRIVVLETTKLDRYAEVVGPVDMHEGMGSEQVALRKLREKASAMGADAVIGVEFHHGEGEGEPSHLSGLAVRFIAPPALPMHGSGY